MLYRIITILQLFFLSLQDCTRLMSQLQIYPSVDEIYEWNIRDTFFSGDAMKFKLADKSSKYFDQIINPLQEIGGSIMHGATVSNVISIKPFISQLTGQWLNSFVFIEQDTTSVDIFYSKGLPTENDKVPNFQNFINVAKSNPEYRCFDVDFITETKFITDCSENEKNYFLIADTQGQTQTIENPQNIQNSTIRKIIVHTFYYVNAKQQYLLRGQHSQENGSLIEVFTINNEQIGNESILSLNSTSLSELIQQEGLNLTFLDMQVEPNGDIFILDSLNGIFILKILQTQKWTLKQWYRVNQQVYAFDFNYLINSTNIVAQLAIVYEDRIQYFQDNIPKATFQIPKTIINKTVQIEISQQYVILIIDTEVFLYNQKQLIYIFQESIFDQLIINPYEPDLVGVSEIASHRFLISDGILRILRQDSSSDTQYLTQIQATPQTGTFCSIDLKLQVLKKNDTQIYSSDSKLFPESLTIPSDPFNIDLLAIGPDISYLPHDFDKTGIEINIKEMWKLNVSIQKENVVFTDLYVIDESSFYIIQQLSTKEAYLYLCEHEKLQQEAGNCTLLKEFSFDKVLTQNIFHWWFESKKIFFAVQEEDAKINFYLFEGQTFASFDQIQETEKILSFNVLFNVIFVVLNNKIQVYDQLLPARLALNITNIQSPQQVFGNRLVDLIFIRTLNEVIVGSMAILTSGSEFTILKTISITQGAEIKVSIGKKYFYIIQKTNEISQIDEYDFMHLQKIFKTKTLPLYDYKIQDNIEADSCEESGWLFVRCQDEKQTVILIYEPGVLNHQSLKKVIKLDSIQQISIEADGGLQMFLHYSQQIYSILQDSLIYVKSNIKSDQYVNNIIVGVEAKNDYSNKILTQQIPILDTHSIPIFDNSQNIIQKFQKKSDVAVVKIEKSYYTGQITSIQVDCKQCNETILKPSITPLTTGDDLKYDLIDGLIYNNNYVAYITSSQLIFSYRNGTFYKTINLKDQLTILEQTDGLYISEDKKQLIITVIGSNASFLLIECTAELECKVIKKIVVSQASRIQGLYLFLNNHLFILNSNPNDYTQFESSILAFQINPDYSLALIQIVNAQTLGLQTLNIAGFEIIKHHTFYTVLFTDTNLGIRIINFQQSSLSFISGHDLFQLNNYQNDYYYVHSNTQFLQIKVVTIQNSDKQIKFDTFVQTTNAAQYVFSLNFDIDQAPKLQHSTIKLQLILTPFANWKSVNKVTYDSNHIIVPYTQANQVILLIYDLNGNYNTSHTVTSNYALQENYHGTLTTKFVLAIESQENIINFYTNIKFDPQTQRYFLIKYEYNTNSALLLQNLQNWEEQPINIIISNQYGSAKGQIQITFYDDNDDDDKPTDHSWIWILVGVLGCVVVLLAIFCVFLYYRNKKNKKSLMLIE